MKPFRMGRASDLKDFELELAWISASSSELPHSFQRLVPNAPTRTLSAVTAVATVATGLVFSFGRRIHVLVSPLLFLASSASFRGRWELTSLK